MKIKASRYYLLAFFVYKKVVHLLNNINFCFKKGGDSYEKCKGY